MDRIRYSISGLMVAVAISAVVMASLRANSSAGVNLVFFIALALNLATLTVLPIDMSPRLRLAALGYTIGGWGWMVIVACEPRIDAFVSDLVVIPLYINWVAHRASPGSLVRHSTVQMILLLCHSLGSIALGLAGAAIAWKVRGAPEDETIPH